MFTTWHAGATFASAMVLAAALSLTVSAAGCRSAPLQEGPAGPVAVMPGGNVAQPPAVTGVPAAAGCPAAPYGARFYAPGSSETVALTFDDGPGKSTAAIHTATASSHSSRLQPRKLPQAASGLWPLGKGREPASNKEQLIQGGLCGR